MRKTRSHIAIFILLIATSFCSYIFLNSLEKNSTFRSSTSEIQLFLDNDIENYENDRTIYFPDIAIFKRLLETGGKLLSASPL